MSQRTIRNSVIATVLGVGVLAGCSTNPVSASLAKNPVTAGTLKTVSPPSGFGMGGMMGMGGGVMPISNSPEKSYGVIAFDRPNGFRFRSVIDGTGDSFSSTRIFSYYTGSQPLEGGFFGSPFGCLPQSSYLTVGVSGTVRFTRKNGDLLARVVLRTRSGKIVPDTSKRPENACSKEFPKIEKAENVSEKILTKLVPVIPGKDIRVEMGKTVVTVFLDKDFPADRVPVYPAFTSPAYEGGPFGEIIMGGVSGKLGG
ncbi:MAG: hypothetical protein VST70_05065 [Nitrospirota bacterium]|nr:hypothetical protein [Nitrospirota bacterium]